jgi:outer membrane receptor protein involved in Fe transport
MRGVHSDNTYSRRAAWLFALLPLVAALDAAAAPAKQDKTVQLDTIRIDASGQSAHEQAEQAQRSPSSISVVSRKDIDDAGLTTLTDIAARTPNIVMTNQGSQRFSINTVRGIGSTVREDYFNSTLGVYLDGVPLSNAEFTRRLGDLESAKVLRGPQGTLYGPNTHGGVIELTSREPGNTPGAQLHGVIGNHGQRETSLSASAPLVEDKVFGQVFFDHAQNDGFTDYVSSGDGIDDLDSYSGSGRIRIRPGGDWSLDLAAFLERVNQGGYAYLPFDEYKKREVDIQPKNEEIRDARSLSATLSYDMGWAQLRSITAWRDYDVKSRQDLSYSPMVAQTGGGIADSDEWGRQWSQDVRLQGGEPGRMTWTAGVYWERKDLAYDYLMDVVMYGGPFLSASRYKTESVAGYGETTINLSERLDLTLGARVSHEKHEIENNNPYSDDTSGNLTTPKAALAYHLDDKRQVYISATRGARSGGFDRLTFNVREYSPEYLWSYETGFKSQLLDDTLMFNAALFYIDWRDLQIKSLAGPGQVVTDNAGKAHSEGLELETRWTPDEHLELSGFFAATHGKYDDLTDSNGVDRSGNTLVYTPNVTAGAAAQYSWPLQILPANASVRAEYLYTGKHYFDLENRLEQKAYGLTNLRAGLSKDGVGVSLFVNNLFDKDYRTFAALDTWGFDYTTAGEPRTVGVAVDWKL